MIAQVAQCTAHLATNFMYQYFHFHVFRYDTKKKKKLLNGSKQSPNLA
jgi:hypothetical protein